MVGGDCPARLGPPESPAASSSRSTSRWGRSTSTRLSATNVAAVEVRRSQDSDHDEAPWQVVIVPRPTFSGLAATAGPGGVFDAGCYGSQAYAERVRRALHEHLGL